MRRLSREELAFTGFFAGEGMFRISRDRRKRYSEKRGGWNKGSIIEYHYRSLIRITVRQDDDKCLDWCVEHFGGHIFRRGIRLKVWNRKRDTYSQSNPITIWQVEDMQSCKNISEILLLSPLPFKKKEEAKVMLEFIELRQKYLVKGTAYPTWVYNKFGELHDKISYLKKYKEE